MNLRARRRATPLPSAHKPQTPHSRSPQSTTEWWTSCRRHRPLWLHRSPFPADPILRLVALRIGGHLLPVDRRLARLWPLIRMPYPGYLERPKKHTYLRGLGAAVTRLVAVNVGAIRNWSSSHEHHSSSPSNTLRAAMGCSFRFAGNSGRTKEECRIESLAGQLARARQSQRKTRRVEA